MYTSLQQNTRPDYRTNYSHQRRATASVVNQELKIEIRAEAPPIPPKRYLQRKRKAMIQKQKVARETKYKLEQLKPGGFAFYTGATLANIANAASVMKKQTGFNYISRQWEEGGAEGVGLWCE